MIKKFTAFLLSVAVVALTLNLLDVRAATVPQIQALFETSLQASITSNATSTTLVSGTDLAGNTLNGYYCFTIDAGTVQNEFVCGNASGTALTNLVRGVNPALGISSNVSLEFSHRRGADVKITDSPYLSIYSNIFNGSQGIPSSMYYDAHPTSTASTTIEDKNYIDTSVIAGGVPATSGVAGIAPLATQATLNSGQTTSSINSNTYTNVIPAGLYGKLFGGTPTSPQISYVPATTTAQYNLTVNNLGSSTSFQLPTLVNGNTVLSYTSMTVTVYGQAVSSSYGGSASGTINNPSTSTVWYYGAQGAGLGNNDTGGALSGTTAGQGGGGGTQAFGGAGGTGIYGYNGLVGSAGQGGSVSGNGSDGGGGGGYYGGGGGGATGSNTASYCLGGANGGNMAWFSSSNSYTNANALLVGGGAGGYGAGCGNIVLGGYGGGSTAATGTVGYYTSGSQFASGAGGGGSSFASSTYFSATTVSTSTNSGNPYITVAATYIYQPPTTEFFQPTITGFNNAMQITFPNSTVHITPSTTTINFAAVPSYTSNPMCLIQEMNTSTILGYQATTTTSSVQLGFSAAIAGTKWNLFCEGN